MQTELKNQRSHDLDWLRFIAIVILLFFHTGMLFNSWEWHIKNNETSTSYEYWMVWLHFWRMPLLLFISGAGTFMALNKRTPGEYAGERFKRLFIPLVFGMFVIVPPQIYYEYIQKYDGYADFYRTVFDFVPYPPGSFSWHHLWFIAYLFLYSLIAIPFLIYLRSVNSLKFKSALAKIITTPAGLLFIPALLILVTQLLLRLYFPEETHSLLDDWAYFVFYFCFFLFGMICYSDRQLWNSISHNRRHLLVASIAIMLPFYITFCHFKGVITLPWTMDTVDDIFSITAIIGSWFWVVTVIAFGQHYLNKSHKWLKHVNEGLYPFYILHQTVIIVVGYYVCKLVMASIFKFFIVSILTLIICVALYLLLIRPFNLTRLLFGMKMRKTENETVTAVRQQI